MTARLTLAKLSGHDLGDAATRNRVRLADHRT
jgi:hypothetical protein